MTQAVQKIEPQEITSVPITPTDLITQALDKGAGVEVMEKLLALQQRWDAMQAKKAFDNAIADLRMHLPDIVKDQEGYGYKYEDLSDIVKAVSPVMAEHGLSFRYRTGSANGTVSVTCIIAHRDGHSEETTLESAPDTTGSKNSIQAIGSAVSYLQRYTLKAALGIAAARDDDGHAAADKPEPQKKSASKDQEARAIYTQAEHDIRAAHSINELKGEWERIDWSSIPNDWRKDLIAEKDARLAQLRTPVEDDPFPGDLPNSGYIEPNFDDFPQETRDAINNLSAG